MKQNIQSTTKVIKSSIQNQAIPPRRVAKGDNYHFIDTIAVIQDVAFKLERPTVRLHWWNKLGNWLSNLGRR